MVKEREAGRTRLLGVSNVSLRHLERMVATGVDVRRRLCRIAASLASGGIARSGRSAGTAASSTRDSPCSPPTDVLRDPLVAGIASRAEVTAAQVVFRFAQAVGMLPLTGTSDPRHMTQDLASRDLSLSPDEVRAIESLAG